MSSNDILAVSGPAWRIAPSGTAEVYVTRWDRDKGTALVCSRVGGGWAKRPMSVALVDVFATRAEARAEYARRKIAGGYRPEERPNLSTYLP